MYLYDKRCNWVIKVRFHSTGGWTPATPLPA